MEQGRQVVFEGFHEFVAVRNLAFPHDTASIHWTQFNAEQHELARDHFAESVDPHAANTSVNIATADEPDADEDAGEGVAGVDEEEGD